MIKVKSFKSSESFQPNKKIKLVIINNKDKKHIKTAKAFGTFLLCIQLQKGRNSVARIPPIHNGIRKSLAKYNPKMIKNTRANFCKKVEVCVFIIK